MSTTPTGMRPVTSAAIQPVTSSAPQQPQLNRKQRRKIEKRVRSAKFRRSMRHVIANREREQAAIYHEAINHARSELGAHGQLDINLEAE